MRPSASVLTHLAAFAFRPLVHHHFRYPGTPTVLSLEPLCLGLLSGNSTSTSPHVRLVEPCLWPIRTETPRIGSHSQVPCANDVIFRPMPTRLTSCVRSICALHLDTSDSERPLTDTQSAVHTASDRAECKCTLPPGPAGSTETLPVPAAHMCSNLGQGAKPAALALPDAEPARSIAGMIRVIVHASAATGTSLPTYGGGQVRSGQVCYSAEV